MDRPPAQKWDEKHTLPSTFVSLFISPDKSDILNQTVSSSIDNKPFGPEHCNSPDTHLHTCSHPHVWGDKQALTYCICLPWSYVSIIQHLRDSLSVRFSTAGMCSTDAEHANNLLRSFFYSSTLAVDRFRTAPLGPHEWTCLTEYAFFVFLFFIYFFVPMKRVCGGRRFLTLFHLFSVLGIEM